MRNGSAVGLGPFVELNNSAAIRRVVRSNGFA